MNAKDLISLVDEGFAAKSLDEWAEVFATEPDFFWAPVQTPEEVVNDPQLRAAGGLVEVPDDFGGTTMITSPADFHGTPWAPRSLAPELGQHTDEILAELGQTPAQIAELRSAGVIPAGVIV